MEELRNGEYDLKEKNYLNNKLESTSYISIAADDNYNVHIANSHIKKRATSYLPHRTSTKFLRLHNMHSKCIDHISPKDKHLEKNLCPFKTNVD